MSLEHPFYYGCHRNKRGVFGWIPLDWENETLLMKEHTSMNVEHKAKSKIVRQREAGRTSEAGGIGKAEKSGISESEKTENGRTWIGGCHECFYSGKG